MSRWDMGQMQAGRQSGAGPAEPPGPRVRLRGPVSVCLCVIHFPAWLGWLRLPQCT